MLWGGDQAWENTQDPNYGLGRWLSEDLNSDLQHPHQKLGVATQTPVTPLWWRPETGLAEACRSDGPAETMRVSRNKADRGGAGPLTPSSAHGAGLNTFTHKCAYPTHKKEEEKEFEL